MITLGDAVGNWSDAMRIIEGQLACKKCDAMNAPNVIRIHVDNFGNASCDSCGAAGPLQDFTLPLKGKA